MRGNDTADPWAQPAERPKVEPPAETRRAARDVMELFVALRDEGFTEQQSLVLIGTMLGTVGGSSTSGGPT